MFHAQIESEAASIQIRKLATNHVWLSLIHSDGDRSLITDSDFILSSRDFSPANEMELTLELFVSNEEALCRFPARYLWLRDYFGLPELDYSVCPEFTEYLQMAPADSLELVFASENISQPSSMMGHVLLKLVGVNRRGESVSHAISFYTDAGGVNIPKLFWQSIVVGKKGYFSLTPYRDKVERYLNEEGRNIWEYKLRADKKLKALVHYHIYELKKTDLVYYFDDYNCATLVHYMLGILGVKGHNLFWVTPSDIVKEVHTHNLVEAATLIPSDRWKIKMLSKAVNPPTIKLAKKAVDELDPSFIRQVVTDRNRFVAYEIAESYASLELKRDEMTDADRKNLEKLVAQFELDRSVDSEFNIDLSRYKLPTKTPQDSQVSVGFISWFDQDTYLKLDLLPASHRLGDDNKQYFADTELTLGDISIMVSPSGDSLKVHHLTLYGISSLMPRDKFTGGVSGRFQLGYKQVLHDDLKPHGQFFALGALGQTVELLDGVKSYALVGAGGGSSRFDAYGFIQPELGLLIDRIPALKTRLSFEYLISDSSAIPSQKKISLEQSYFFDQSWSVFARVSKVEMKEYSEEQASISLRHYF